MGVTNIMPAERGREVDDIPWAAIREAVAHLLDQPDTKVIRGNNWSVYRTADVIRIDIRRGDTCLVQ